MKYDFQRNCVFFVVINAVNQRRKKGSGSGVGGSSKSKSIPVIQLHLLYMRARTYRLLLLF